jgi:hypothetical protein
MARKATATKTAEKTSKPVYQVRYVPDWVLNAFRGRKPRLLATETFFIQTEDGKAVARTFVCLGGVPTPKLHEKLTDAGFKLRRANLEYKSKRNNNKTYRLTDSDNGCWSVYYNDSDNLTEEQIKVITGLHTLVMKGTDAGKTFLCPTWKSVNKAWGSTDEWTKIVAAPVEVVEEPEEEEDDDTVILEDDDDVWGCGLMS